MADIPCVIRVRGQISGLDFEFEEQHETLPSVADISAMVEFYVSGIGMKPTTVTATPAPVPVAAGTQARPASSGNGSSNGSGAGFTCQVHGDQNIKYDPRYNRFECKVRSERPEPWASDKPWTDRDGNSWWFCRSRS